MVVGRLLDFGDGSCLQVFRRANGEVRAIRDEPGFRLQVNPPLAADHLYQQHRLQHDPPVRSCINYRGNTGRWVSGGLSERVGGGRLDGLLTQSPHTPVAGCTTTLSRVGDLRYLVLVLTDSSHEFVAWIAIQDWGDGIVDVCVETTESPVAGAAAPFKDRFPVTTRLARVALGSGVVPYVFDGQTEMVAMRVTRWIMTAMGAAEATTHQPRRRMSTDPPTDPSIAGHHRMFGVLSAAAGFSSLCHVCDASHDTADCVARGPFSTEQFGGVDRLRALT
ncbi:unnamed protein product [Vitrella brassicaformis CCMP3155]|uniref:Uncharacterized protein n=1 Tax=Vitrella brassicaformis (strain CCMP3155) TaxID=1169540 RepID=A0A0G4FDQ3_VITBC|nr:unnamed protein product [Vitrella brassicaformis CCMP3155]|eukprot:CEM11089.1 unnamed protein product [Vitrella brassicaformis CCMP3155]